MTAAPLEGFRILDLSRYLPGPLATAMLADLGAEVIKVEDVNTPDPARSMSAMAFATYNRGKEGVALDLRTSAGTQALLDLVANCDAVVESFRPGVLDSMGLGYQRLRSRNAKVLLCSITGYGQDGPYAQRPGHDLNFLALSGFFDIPAQLNEGVNRPSIRLADHAAAMYAALTLAATLPAARRDGEGQWLDVSILDTAAAWTVPSGLVLEQGASNDVNNHFLIGDNDIFATEDGRHIAIATVEDKFWRRMRGELESEFPELRSERFDQRAERTAQKHEVHALLTRTFRQRDFKWWCDRLNGLDAGWAPVATIDDVLLDPHLESRGLFEASPAHDEAEPRVAVRYPVAFAESPGPIRAAPRHGEHTEEVMKRLGVHLSSPLQQSALAHAAGSASGQTANRKESS